MSATHNFSILIIDDESAQADAIAGFLKKKGYQTETANSGAGGAARFAREHFDMVLTDYKMPDISGEEVLQRVRATQPSVPVLIMTAYGNVESAVHLMKMGAFDFVQKPIDLDELLFSISRAEERAVLISENSLLRSELEEKYAVGNVISQSGEMESVLNTVARVAPSQASVLIFGESGTGKELIARAIHFASRRKNERFVTVNCAALPESLFESELFGHEKGAFTGADQRRIGKFEQAQNGTLFIDEVGDIPQPIQVKLLRAIQFKQIERLGGSETIDLDVRIIAATNRNLEAMIQTGEFREDLYYRLNVVSIQLPPLRNRRLDIAPLAEHFISVYAEQNGKTVRGISREALGVLLRYGFPGNVRELENIIQRAVVMTRGDVIATEDLPFAIVDHGSLNRSTAQVSDNGEWLFELGNLNEKVEFLEHILIEKALTESGGNQSKAAELLHISERTLRYKLGKLTKE